MFQVLTFNEYHLEKNVDRLQNISSRSVVHYLLSYFQFQAWLFETKRLNAMADICWRSFSLVTMRAEYCCPAHCIFCIIYKLLWVLNKMKPMQIVPILYHLSNNNKKTAHNCLLQIMFCLAIFLSVAPYSVNIESSEMKVRLYVDLYSSGCMGST